MGLRGDRKQNNSGLTAKAGFDNLRNLTAAQTKESGEAQKATTDRDKAYDTFAKWMNEFYATAAIALQKTPQLMEKIGLTQK